MGSGVAVDVLEEVPMWLQVLVTGVVGVVDEILGVAVFVMGGRDAVDNVVFMISYILANE